jgi:hypothetical protein
MHEGRGGIHYKTNGEKEVCVYMEEEAINAFHKCMGENNPASISECIKKALWAGCAKKHELRAGTKEGNSADQDLEKAKNYRNRQETGEWLSV